MKVLILSPNPELIYPAIEAEGDSWVCSDDVTDGFDYVVSFGHRKIIKREALSIYGDKIINIHISVLPWNRGADPNLWSWIDNTPKGVTIHRIDAGVDTGDIISQKILELDTNHTLASSYQALQIAAVDLFSENWEYIRKNLICPIKQTGAGSYHKSSDKEPWFIRLPLGLDTRVTDLRRLKYENSQ